MNMTPKIDSLVEIPRNDWAKLRNLYKSMWPRGSSAYPLLDLHIKNPDVSAEFNFKVYCPEGNLNNGMVAISDKGHCQVFVCPVDEDRSAIEAALVSTYTIDWDRRVCAPAMNCETLACMRSVSQRLSLQMTEYKLHKHFLDKDSKLLAIKNPPPNTYVGPLKQEYLDLVNRTWTLYSADCRYYFGTLAKKGRIFVLYSSIGHKPLCWMSVDEAGAMTHMYCLGIYRKNGYAEYLTKFVTNHMLKPRKDVYVYTLHGNAKPYNLFHKLGFESLGFVTLATFTKKTE